MLLGATAIGLARPLADLLIGRSVAPERVELARRTVAASAAVDEVRQLFAVYVAPQDAILTAKVRAVSGLSVQELARAMDDLDRLLRTELPEIGDVFIDVTNVTDRDSRDLRD